MRIRIIELLGAKSLRADELLELAPESRVLASLVEDFGDPDFVDPELDPDAERFSS
jgi:hypothetical protein